MRFFLGLTCLALLTGCSKDTYIKVGSKNFTEQLVIGELVAQHLEKRLGRPVVRKLGLTGTLLVHQALLNGDIDIYPEYTGTALTNVLKQQPIKDPAAMMAKLREGYKPLGIEWLDSLGFEDTFAMVIRGSEARERHLSTLSDAANDKRGFRLGAFYEFVGRPDGFQLLQSTYPIVWQGLPKNMDLGLLYSALTQSQVDMVAANSTDGPLSALDVKVLDDDKHAFPPYQTCLLARSDALVSQAGLRAALAELSGKIDTESMRKMNYEVDAKHRRPAEVAEEFLKSRQMR